MKKYRRYLAFFLSSVMLTTLSLFVESPEVKAFSDVSSMTDQTFFGVWNGSGWTTAGKINYSYSSSLSPVESYVKAGDYNNAKNALLTYFRNRTTRSVPELEEKIRNTKKADLICDNIFPGAGYEQYETSITVNGTYQIISAPVTVSAVNGYNEGKKVAFMIMGRRKGSDVAYINSKENSANKPKLSVVSGGQTYEITAEADTYVECRTPDNNYGTAANLAVKDSGYPFDEYNRRTYIMFDLSTIPSEPDSANLILYAKNASAPRDMELAIFRYPNTAWDEGTLTWNNMASGTFSWCGNPNGTDWTQPGSGVDGQYNFVITRFYFANQMAYEYHVTGNDNYVSNLVRHMLDFIADKGNANAGFPGSLHSAIRANNWVTAYHYIKDSTALDAAANTAILKYLWQHGAWLNDPAHFTTGSNYGVIETTGLYYIAAYFPEFSSSASWLNTAKSRLDFMADVLVNQDGTYIEDTSAYTAVCINLFMSCKSMGAVNGLTFGYKLDNAVQSLAKYLMDIGTPDGYDPMMGDADLTDIKPTIAKVGDLYGRADFQYYGSGGAAGTAPPYQSIYYPDVQVAAMRSGWSSDDNFMLFHNYAAFHGHTDPLAITAYAFGRTLLTDNGRNSYTLTDPVSDWLRYSTEAHNTIQINDKNTPYPGVSPRYMDTAVTNEGMDFFEGSHGLYSGFNHNRAVLYVKPDYWIVSDYVTTSTSGTNKYEQNWHYLPFSNAALDGATKRTKTNFSSGPNIQVVPADPAELAASIETGYYSTAYMTTMNADYTSYVKNASGAITFDTVLYPTAADDTNRDVRVSRLSTGADKTVATALKIEQDYGHNGNTGYYYLSHELYPATARSFDAYNYDGKLAYVEKTSTGTLKKADMVEGKVLKQNTTNLISSNTTILDIDVQWNGNILDINGKYLKAGQDTTNGIAIYAPSATTVKLNGSNIAYTRVGDYVYAVVCGAVGETVYVEAPRVAAAASSEHNSSWAAAKVKDDNTVSCWSSATQAGATGNQWVQVDMGANYSIKKVKLVPRTTNGVVYCSPEDFKLQYSTNGADWTDIPGNSFQGYPAMRSSGEEFVFSSPVTARYIRVVATRFRTDGTNYYFQLSELYPYYETIQASRYNAAASSEHSSSWKAVNVADGKRSTCWSSAWQTGETGSEWVYVDMGGRYDVSKVKLVPRHAAGTTYCFPKDFKLQYSMDGNTWTDIQGQSYTNYPNPTSYLGEIFTLGTPVTARYLRVLATRFRTDGTNYYFQLDEVCVY